MRECGELHKMCVYVSHMTESAVCRVLEERVDGTKGFHGTCLMTLLGLCCVEHVCCLQQAGLEGSVWVCVWRPTPPPVPTRLPLIAAVCRCTCSFAGLASVPLVYCVGFIRRFHPSVSSVYGCAPVQLFSLGNNVCGPGGTLGKEERDALAARLHGLQPLDCFLPVGASWAPCPMFCCTPMCCAMHVGALLCAGGCMRCMVWGATVQVHLAG